MSWFRIPTPTQPTRIEFDAARLEEQMAIWPNRSPRGIVDRWICAGLKHWDLIRIRSVRIFGTCAICGDAREPVIACAECDRDVCLTDLVGDLCCDCERVAVARRKLAASVVSGGSL